MSNPIRNLLTRACRYYLQRTGESLKPETATERQKSAAAKSEWEQFHRYTSEVVHTTQKRAAWANKLAADSGFYLSPDDVFAALKKRGFTPCSWGLKNMCNPSSVQKAIETWAGCVGSPSRGNTKQMLDDLERFTGMQIYIRSYILINPVRPKPTA